MGCYSGKSASQGGDEDISIFRSRAVTTTYTYIGKQCYIPFHSSLSFKCGTGLV